jgi:hypothetical protein
MENGPLQVAVIEFVDGRFTGAIAAAFDELDPAELAGFRQMGAEVGGLCSATRSWPRRKPGSWGDGASAR